MPPVELPEDLITLQQAADEEGRRIEHLDGEEQNAQRRVWFNAAAEVHMAVTDWAREQGLNRYDVEKELRQRVRHVPHG
ncbi:hypothetical protein GA0115257_121912 [Streptomyces sp. LcepLS]|nr:hypothetical protein GA0115251_10066 [Streptomyces sp. TverLS-915]SCE26967.1 hypothetical protein GA0115246_113463 [Streptomyces sp. SolWspMP-sol7th]SCF49297.1 hypothetical protein GA0115257_121912 [Streptomyces sp. LcepLS]